jgi:hypothetical protein
MATNTTTTPSAITSSAEEHKCVHQCGIAIIIERQVALQQKGVLNRSISYPGNSDKTS